MSKKKLCLLTTGLLLGTVIGAAAAFILFAPEEKKHCPCLKFKGEEA